MLEPTFIIADSECHTGLNGSKKKAISRKPIINGFPPGSTESLLSSSPAALKQKTAFFRYTEILTLNLKQEPGVGGWNLGAARLTVYFSLSPGTHQILVGFFGCLVLEGCFGFQSISRVD